MTAESNISPVVPAPDSLTRFFWTAAHNHRLMIQRCRSCGNLQHPPEPVCHQCLSFDLGHAEMSGRATVYSYEIATKAFHPYFEDKLPFVIAVVELVEQPNLRLITNLVDIPIERVEIGMPVEVSFQPLTDEVSLPVFRPAAATTKKSD